MSGVAVVRLLARAVARVFYRIDCVGDVPAGPVLLLPNHPNALLDPAIVWATAGRDVRFLAKSTLFEGPLRPILAAAGAIPVYRRIDAGADTSRNAATFEAVAAALAAGDAVCLFPEGISHSSGRLEPLRTGAARMALAAVRRGTAVALVPAGLNFDRKSRFRSRVTVAFGAAFGAHDLLPSREDDLPAAVRALTDRIAAHMRQILIEADPAADATLVDRVDRLYAAARSGPQQPAARLARRRVIAAGIHRLRRADSARYDELLLKLRRYDQRLRRFGIRDRHLDWSVSRADALRFAAREAAALLVLGPLCAAGLMVFYVPYQLTALAARLATTETDIMATAQVVAGAAIYGAWVALGATAAGLAWGAGAAAAVAIGLPLLALAALFALEREAAVVDTVRAWLLLRRAGRDTRERLRRARSDLADVLDEVHAWLGGQGTGASSTSAGQPQRTG